MKLKHFLIAPLLLCSVSGFAQTKMHARRNKNVDSTVNVAMDSTKPNVAQLPQGTVMFFLTPQQVQLLQDVINQSEAGHRDVMILTQILQKQQYVTENKPVAGDGTSWNPHKGPKLPSDSTANKMDSTGRNPK